MTPSRCGGICDHGWTTVSPKWVEHQAPWPPQPDDGASPELLVEYGHAVEQVRLRRTALSNSVYPCKLCQPGLFYRWAAGHFDVGHDAGSCDQCSDVRRGKTIDTPAAPDTSDPRRDIYQ